MSCIQGMNHLYYTYSFVLHNFTELVMFAHMQFSIAQLTSMRWLYVGSLRPDRHTYIHLNIYGVKCIYIRICVCVCIHVYTYIYSMASSGAFDVAHDIPPNHSLPSPAGHI